MTLLAALALLGPALGPAAIQGGSGPSQAFEDVPVSVSLYSFWPDGLRTGWAPLLVEVENRSDADVVVELELEGYRDHPNELRDAVPCAAGETEVRELLVPVFGEQHGYAVLASLGGDELELSYNLGSSEAAGVLLVLRTDAGPHADDPNFEHTKRTDPVAASLPPGVTFTPPEEPLFSTRTISPSEASRRFEAYSSLDAVLLDLGPGVVPGRLEPEVLEPLLAWVRAGGILVAWHRDGRAWARGTPGLAPWMEERFQLAPELQAVGLGLVLFATEDGWFDAKGRALTRQAGRLGEIVERTLGSRLPEPGTGQFPILLGLEELPYRGLVLVLVLFAILIGPVNFLFVKATGRQHLLLLTIPLLAGAVSLGLLVFGVLHQGLDLRRATFAYTVLDQRDHRAATYATETLFAGWVPGEGLRSGPRTAVVPYLAGSPNDWPSFRVDQGEERHLTGGFLPARRPARHTLASEGAARGRLTFEPTEDALSVQNGLGADLERLVLRDARKELWVLDAPLAEGGSALLKRLVSSMEVSELDEALRWAELGVEDGPPREPERWTRHWIHFVRSRGDERRLAPRDLFPVAALDDLWPASYLAITEGTPFVDDLGLETVPSGGRQVVLGVLDPGELGR